MYLQQVTKDAWGTRRQRRREQAHWEKVRNAQTFYTTQLHKVARQVGEIISHYVNLTEAQLPEIEDILNRYAHLIRPWASSTATQMITEVARRDETAWHRHSVEVGRSLRQEIQQTPIGAEAQRLHQEQVGLITNIPIQAAEEIQQLIQKAYREGRRFESVAPEIQEKVPDMTYNRATLIARTETGKIATSITRARSESIGATHYIWRTARDADVRRTHRKLEGTTHAWNNPPIAEEQGQRHHPGEFPNCRCFAQPIIDEVV